MTGRRRKFSAQDKVSILRRHFLGKVSVSSICAQLDLNPNVFYRWRREFFEKGAIVFERRNEGATLTSRDADSLSVSRRAEPAPHCRDCARRRRREADRDWMLRLGQGKLCVEDVCQAIGEGFDRADALALLDGIRHKPLKYRNRAIAVLSHYRGLRARHIATFLGVAHCTVDNWIRRFREDGCDVLLGPFKSNYQKAWDEEYSSAVFEILHAPPNSYGINRTTWRLQDIQSVMAERGLSIGRASISQIIRNAGYRYRKARKVLTSRDPDYREKVEAITRILSDLGPNEKFFSVDEFGPFAVKMQGGRSLVPPGRAKTVPQWQVSKGSLIITGALELSTNQVTHFYSARKNTAEMIKLLDLLVVEHADQECIYFSWDAASWHASKALYARVEEINHMGGAGQKVPRVKLAPLPSGAQFLNVIESVFSGMARAVLHNSDYESVVACMLAIDRHFAERNQYFRENPKRAGNKIWGREPAQPRFSESSNCKDPRY